MNTYKVAEKFKSIQGEGMYSGTPMAFIRFVGCSVGKRICQHCDTDFDTTLNWRGGGEFTIFDLLTWADNYQHICLTGGEPLNQYLEPLVDEVAREMRRLLPPEDEPTTLQLHVETSGTVPIPGYMINGFTHICISPKPGWLEENIQHAHEIKVIVPGLGEITPQMVEHRVKVRMEDPTVNLMQVQEELQQSFRWPTLHDALRWAALEPDRPVYLQPRNGKYDLDKNNLVIVQDLIREYPQLRLSVQMHKVLHVQ